MTSLNNRIRDLIQDKNLSPSHFADEIGVQRSSISHILSGRNRPSLEIVQKIIRRFPDLSYEWLLDGSVSGPGAPQAQKKQMVGENNFLVTRTERSDVLIAKAPKKIPREGVKSLTLSQESTIEEERDKKTKVVKITLFYEDNTFQEFKPNL